MLKLCPRCEINWIKEDEDYCKVCKAELGLDGGIELDLLSDDDDYTVCPICGENEIKEGQEMCNACYIEQKKLDKASFEIYKRDDRDTSEIPYVAMSDIEDEDEDDEEDIISYNYSRKRSLEDYDEDEDDDESDDSDEDGDEDEDEDDE